MKHFTGFLIRRERLRRNLSQEGLCKGICSVSYLSKIEQGQVLAGPEIVERLLEALGLRAQVDAQTEAAAARALREYFDRFLLCTLSADGRDAWLDAHAEALESSPLALSVGLYRACIAMHTDDHAALAAALEALSPFVDYLQGEQLALYAMGRALLCEDEHAREEAFTQAERLRPCSLLLSWRAHFSFARGRYIQAGQEAERAYALACEEGNGSVLFDASFLLGCCYANQRHYPSMMRAFRRTLALAHTLRPDAVGKIEYNIGATCLELCRHEEARDWLEAALAHVSSNDVENLLVRHKLALVYAHFGQCGQARQALAEARAFLSPELPAIYDRMLRVAELRLTPGYLDDPDYAALLRTVYDEASDALHFGFKQFHASFLIEAYVHQRRYKDALQISQEIGMFSES